MRYFKLKKLILIGLILFIYPAYCFAEDNISFKWTFGAMTGSDDNKKFIDIKRGTQLTTGDQLKMFIQLKKECFIYVFYKDSQEKIYLLFPYNPNHFATSCQTAKKYYIPQDNLWFQLDENKGIETFYLLASIKPLLSLETLYQEYLTAQPDKQPEIGHKIIDQIKIIKKSHRKLSAKAERPVQIGGVVRGMKINNKLDYPDLANNAVEVSAKDFYSRTYKIEHQ